MSEEPGSGSGIEVRRTGPEVLLDPALVVLAQYHEQALISPVLIPYVHTEPVGSVGAVDPPTDYFHSVVPDLLTARVSVNATSVGQEVLVDNHRGRERPVFHERVLHRTHKWDLIVV